MTVVLLAPTWCKHFRPRFSRDWSRSRSRLRASDALSRALQDNVYRSARYISSPASSSRPHAQPTPPAPPLPSIPTTAPKISLNIRHIREHPELYAEACRAKNYGHLSSRPQRIEDLFEEWKTQQQQGRSLRQRANALRAEIERYTHNKDLNTSADSSATTSPLLEEARLVKSQLQSISEHEKSLQSQMHHLAQSLPNPLSALTPIGTEPHLLSEIQPDTQPLTPSSTTSHADIGTHLDILSFSSASAVSGWGFYYLKNAGMLLEQALVQYALSVSLKHGFAAVAPPSLVYSHIATACGFQPRDTGGEQQIYTLAQPQTDGNGTKANKPELSLAATAEIPLAGMHASSDLAAKDLPMKVVGVSRCYRAEAGARGVETKGLYRVHEFTKVELFCWSLPDAEQQRIVFDGLLDVQREILEGLGLRCRVLEQPSADLGASAARKVDVEAFFPSRVEHDGGWGEVTSASECTDYQTRRLATRVRVHDKEKGERLAFPFTVNGTALAVPRVVAAILENYWEERSESVKVPEVLWPWMHGTKEIRKR